MTVQPSWVSRPVNVFMVPVGNVNRAAKKKLEEAGAKVELK